MVSTNNFPTSYPTETKFLLYTDWKGNKCHPFNSRRGRLKGSIYIYIYIYTHTICGLNLIVFSEKGVSCSVLFTSYCLYRQRLCEKITSVGLSYKEVILFSKIFCVFYVVYVKSNRVACYFSGLSVVATL